MSSHVTTSETYALVGLRGKSLSRWKGNQNTEHKALRRGGTYSRLPPFILNLQILANCIECLLRRHGERVCTGKNIGALLHLLKNHTRVYKSNVKIGKGTYRYPTGKNIGALIHLVKNHTRVYKSNVKTGKGTNRYPTTSPHPADKYQTAVIKALDKDCHIPIQHSILAHGDILITSGGSTPILRHNTSATHPVFICKDTRPDSLGRNKPHGTQTELSSPPPHSSL